jgi:hypothetical protein
MIDHDLNAIERAGVWIYSYGTDFCINAANLLGIDYVTFGSVFFGGLMNGVIVVLIILNIFIKKKGEDRVVK